MFLHTQGAVKKQYGAVKKRSEYSLAHTTDYLLFKIDLEIAKLFNVSTKMKKC